MSSPPPGGPPSNQPPYPQQYPPAQPYPPPQQPYYAPPVPPPPQRSNVLLIVVIVVVVVAVVAAIGWYAVTLMMRPITGNTITVTGVSWTVAYPGSTQYFGASPLTTCNGCPITVTFPNTFQYTLTLTNSDTVSHNVTGITVSGVTFSLISASPDPTTGSPVSIGAGASRSFILTIQTSPFSGTYTLSGVIDTR